MAPHQTPLHRRGPPGDDWSPRRGDCRTTAVALPHGLQDPRAELGLRDEPGGTVAARRVAEDRVVVGGGEQDERRMLGGGEALAGLEPIDPRQADVEQHELRLQPVQEVQRVLAAGHLGDGLETRRGSDDGARGVSER